MSRESYYSDGRQGGIVLSGTASATGSFRRIVILNETVLATLEDGSLANVVDIEGKTLPAGLTFGGNFTSITLTSGLLIAYYA